MPTFRALSTLLSRYFYLHILTAVAFINCFSTTYAASHFVTVRHPHTVLNLAFVVKRKMRRTYMNNEIHSADIRH